MSINKNISPNSPGASFDHKSSTPSQKPKPNFAKEFIEFCEKRKFVGYSFTKILIDSQGKKKPIGMPRDRDSVVTQDTWTHFVSTKDSAFAVITGRCSGITVIDVDDHTHYDSLIAHHPELAQYLTIKTAKGYHIYCAYDQDVKTTTGAFVEPWYYSQVTNQNGKITSKCMIDIRNDEAIVFAPPTWYSGADGSIQSYKILIDGPLNEIPRDLKAKLKQCNEKRITLTPSMETSDKDDQDIIEPFLLKAIPERIATFKILFALINKQKRLANREAWIALGFMIYNEIGVLDNQAGLNLFCSLCDPGFVDACTAAWLTFKIRQKNTKGMGSLTRWAKEDLKNQNIFQNPWKRYIFTEPLKYTPEELILKASETQCGLYGDVLAKRVKLKNNLSIYDPHCKVLGSVAAEWSQNVTNPDVIIETLQQYTAYIAQGKPVMIVKAQNGDGQIEWQVVTYPSWKAGCGEILIKQVEQVEKQGDIIDKVTFVPLSKFVLTRLIDLQFNCAGFIPFSNESQRALIDPKVFNLFNGFEGYLARPESPINMNRVQMLIECSTPICELFAATNLKNAFSLLETGSLTCFSSRRTKGNAVSLWFFAGPKEQGKMSCGSSLASM